MSRLYYTDRGHVVPTMCEELTSYRKARKVLELPGTRESAVLYVLARSYPDSPVPMRVCVNGSEVAAVAPDDTAMYRWREVVLPAALLKQGANLLEFWADSSSMTSWSLGMELGQRNPTSFISTDAGETWRNEKMGHLNASLGEYIVRVRLAEGQDPPPPEVAWEDPDFPRLEQLRRRIPSSLLQSGTTLGRVRTLTSWVCTSWEYRNTADAAQYAPWDAETILDWGAAGVGHNGQVPVVMCVHYAVTLVSCCLAAGIPARPAVFTGGINSPDGHFTTEVWLEEYQKWVMVDPTVDAIFFKDGIPMSVSEIQQAGSDLAGLVEWGPGYRYHVEKPGMAEVISRTILSGLCFRHRSIWPRTDLLSHPEYSPPGHGATCYCETDLVWETRDLERGLGMFPYFGDVIYFDAPPPDAIRRAGR